jgi:transcriptional regulator with XRE-family HTH domain
MRNNFMDIAEESKGKLGQLQRTRQKWNEEGQRLLQWRERLGLTRAFIAQETGVSPGRLTRLEQGDPVKEARLICKVYTLTLEKVEMHRALDKLVESIGIRK